LNEEDEGEEEEELGETRDDERSGTRYNVGTIYNPHTIPSDHLLAFDSQYSWFHVIFAIGMMYVAMLLTDW